VLRTARRSSNGNLFPQGATVQSEETRLHLKDSHRRINGSGSAAAAAGLET
jgi:hypothetical protein